MGGDEVKSYSTINWRLCQWSSYYFSSPVIQYQKLYHACLNLFCANKTEKAATDRLSTTICQFASITSSNNLKDVNNLFEQIKEIFL